MNPAATPAPEGRAFEVRHLQLARALFATIAAVMITFSPDHSATVGLAVFSGFAIATGLVFLLSAWLVFPAGGRAPSALLGAVAVVAGMIAGVVVWRSTAMFFGVVISWALLSGAIEIIAAVRARRGATDAASRGLVRDGITVGVLTAVLGAGLLLVPAQYALNYAIEGAGAFTLTGITIAVGLFGGWAAIVAVYLGIAGLSPRQPAPISDAAPSADAPVARKDGAV